MDVCYQLAVSGRMACDQDLQVTISGRNKKCVQFMIFQNTMIGGKKCLCWAFISFHVIPLSFKEDFDIKKSNYRTFFFFLETVVDDIAHCVVKSWVKCILRHFQGHVCSSRLIVGLLVGLQGLVIQRVSFITLASRELTITCCHWWKELPGTLLFPKGRNFILS